MFKRAVLPVVLIATFASLPMLQSEQQAVVTHSERITAKQIKAKFEVSGLSAGLPQTWCGTRSSVDQTVNATNNSSPKFKFYYVRAANEADRFDAVADQIQKSISTMHSFLIEVSGGTRTLSLDLGTSCSALHADITSITLPGNAADYRDELGYIDPDATIDLLEQVSGVIGGPPRRHIFILDQFDPAGYMEGAGVMYLDDRAIPTNSNNNPGLVGYVATPAGSTDQPVMAALPEVMLHEMTHTMGGVQDSAPNSTSAGHCVDGKDIMCYDDLSPEGAGYDDNVCNPAAVHGLAMAYDCNNDDYFNTSPASGSYLATRWNVFNSKYLLACTADDPYCTTSPTVDPPDDNGSLLDDWLDLWGKLPDPSTATPAARTSKNTLYRYKKGKRGKKVGTVTVVGNKQTGTTRVRNNVTMSKLRMPKGSWKVTICFRETNRRAICQTKTRKTSKSGYLTMPRIYVTTDTSTRKAWGTVTVKPKTKKNKKQRIEVRTSKKLVKFSLNF